MTFMLKYVGAALLAAAAMHANAAIVSNGSFASGSGSTATDWYGGDGYSWNSSAQNLTLSTANASYAYQSIMLDWGKTYTLSFTAAGSGYVDLWGQEIALTTATPYYDYSFNSSTTATYSITFTTPDYSCRKACYLYTHVEFGALASAVTVDNVSVTAVPEPETYAMMLAGLGAIGFMARRRRAS